MERQPEEKQGVTATEIVARMKEAAGVSSVAELSKFVGYRSNAIQNTVSRGHVPFKEAAMVSDKTGVSLDWLVFGAGSKSPKRVAEEPARYDAPQVSRGLLIQSIQEVLDAAPKGRRRGGGPSVADIAETIAWIYEDYLAEQREQRARHRDAASLLRLVVNR